MRVILTGDYPYPMPAELITALEDSMRQHAKAYGLRNVTVETEVNEDGRSS